MTYLPPASFRAGGCLKIDMMSVCMGRVATSVGRSSRMMARFCLISLISILSNAVLLNTLGATGAGTVTD